MAEPISTITNWDQFLRIWAIVGPLAVAAASAIWSRYTKSQDRLIDRSNDNERLERERTRERERMELEHAHELERVEHAKTTKLLELKGAKRDERYSEAKDALVNFMANSQEFTLKQIDFLGNRVPELKQLVKDANDKYNYSYQLVQLIGNDDIKNAASTLLNTSLDFPRKATAQPRNEPEYEKSLNDYQTAKAQFSTIARVYLQSLDPHVDLAE